MYTTAQSKIIMAVSPLLSECKGTREADRVSMALMWGISPTHQDRLWNILNDYNLGFITAHVAVCTMHDYLQGKYF